MRQNRSIGSDGFQPAPGVLSTVLRQVRALRGRSAPEVAKSMGLPLRTYQAFETGRQSLKVDLIFRFASALEGDPFAILLAVLLNAPALAVVSADNKLATALVLELKAFEERAGHTASNLRTTQLLGSYRRLFDGLVREAADENRASSQLLAQLRQDEPASPADPKG